MIISLSPKVTRILIIAVFILCFATAGYFFYQYQKVQQQLANPTLFAQSETQKLLDKLSKIIELPENETPTVATISDRERLQNQPFFAKAKNGDKLIIYTNAKKAIIFDPLANKIIDVAPVNIGTASATPSASISPNQQTLKFVLYNGTTKSGLTLEYEQILKKAVVNSQIIDRDNAKKTDYEKSVLIDLTGTKAKDLEYLSKQLGIAAGQFPEGETKPSDADFLILLGKDFTDK